MKTPIVDNAAKDRLGTGPLGPAILVYHKLEGKKSAKLILRIYITSSRIMYNHHKNKPSSNYYIWIVATRVTMLCSGTLLLRKYICVTIVACIIM